MKHLKYINFYLTFISLSLLASCGGGGGSDTSSKNSSLSNTTFSPASTIQSLYEFVGDRSDANYRYRYTQLTNETIEGTSYKVQSILVIDNNGNNLTKKRYYLINPFRIFTPPYSYYGEAVNGSIPNTIYNTLSYGQLPLSAKIGDFGVYETSTAINCNNFGAPDCRNLSDLNSTWTLEQYDSSLAALCFGTANSPRLTERVCYNINSSIKLYGDSQIIHTINGEFKILIEISAAYLIGLGAVYLLNKLVFNKKPASMVLAILLITAVFILSTIYFTALNYYRSDTLGLPIKKLIDFSGIGLSILAYFLINKAKKNKFDIVTASGGHVATFDSKQKAEDYLDKNKEKGYSLQEK